VFSNFHLVQDHVNDIDFDYKEYARQRFEQYWQKKSAILTSWTVYKHPWPQELPEGLCCTQKVVQCHWHREKLWKKKHWRQRWIIPFWDREVISPQLNELQPSGFSFRNEEAMGIWLSVYSTKAIKIKIQSGVACCMFSLASAAESRGAVVVSIVSICLMLMCWRIWLCAWGVLSFGTTHPLYTR
jgi:hypothetical protein